MQAAPTHIPYRQARLWPDYKANQPRTARPLPEATARWSDRNEDWSGRVTSTLDSWQDKICRISEKIIPSDRIPPGRNRDIVTCLLFAAAICATGGVMAALAGAPGLAFTCLGATYASLALTLKCCKHGSAPIQRFFDDIHRGLVR